MKVIGKVCDKHPERDGARYALYRNGKPIPGACVACNYDRGKVWRSKNRDRDNLTRKSRAKRSPEKARLYGERYANTHKEKLAIKSKKWRAKNREQAHIIDKRRRLKNPEIIKQRMTEWYQRNRHVVYASNAVRRGMERRAKPAWANMFFIEEIYDLAALRTKHTGIRWSVDHIVPLKSKIVCGLHVENNLRVIPLTANISKGNRHWPDMAGATL